jgi:hypothetical protein
MAREWSVLTGVGLGAGLVYVLDPVEGRRRRRMIADRAASVVRDSKAGAARAARQLGSHVEGAAAAVGRPFRRTRNYGLPGELPEAVPADAQTSSPDASDLVDERWPASRRCLAATAGSALVGWGIRRGDGLGLALGSAGAALLARAGANRSLIEVVGIRKGPKLVGVHKTIAINAPIEKASLEAAAANQAAVVSPPTSVSTSPVT